MEKASIGMRPLYEFSNTLAAASASEIDELADRSQSLEQRIASLNDSYETLKKREIELTEWRHVLAKCGSFFDRVGGLSYAATIVSNTSLGSRSYRRHQTIDG